MGGLAPHPSNTSDKRNPLHRIQQPHSTVQWEGSLDFKTWFCPAGPLRGFVQHPHLRAQQARRRWQDSRCLSHISSVRSHLNSISQGPCAHCEIMSSNSCALAQRRCLICRRLCLIFASSTSSSWARSPLSAFSVPTNPCFREDRSLAVTSRETSFHWFDMNGSSQVVSVFLPGMRMLCSWFVLTSLELDSYSILDDTQAPRASWYPVLWQQWRLRLGIVPTERWKRHWGLFRALYLISWTVSWARAV